MVQKSKKWRVVVDDNAGPEYDDIQADTLVFNSDSKHVIYAAIVGNKRIITVDDQEGPVAYDGIASFPAVCGEGFEMIAPRGRMLYRVFWKP